MTALVEPPPILLPFLNEIDVAATLAGFELGEEKKRVEKKVQKLVLKRKPSVDSIERRATDFLLPWELDGKQYKVKLLVYFDAPKDIGTSGVLALSPKFHRDLALFGDWEASNVPDEMKRLRKQKKLSYALALPCGLLVDLFAHEKRGIHNTRLANNWPVQVQSKEKKEEFTTDNNLRYALHSSATALVSHEFNARVYRKWMAEGKYTREQFVEKFSIKKNQAKAGATARANDIGVRTMRSGLVHLFELVPPAGATWDSTDTCVEIVQSLKNFGVETKSRKRASPDK